VSTGPQAAHRHRPDWAVLGIALFLAGLAAVVAWDAQHLNSAAATYSRIGAGAFPLGIAGVLAVLAALTALSAFRSGKPEREPLEFGPLAWIVGGLVLQIALLGVAGFSVATGLLFAMTARGFGGKPLWLTIPIGILISFALYVVFSQGLELSLPQGPLERLI
jgi:putative tricarboxylic transport membrane protein